MSFDISFSSVNEQNGIFFGRKEKKSRKLFFFLNVRPICLLVRVYWPTQWISFFFLLFSIPPFFLFGGIQLPVVMRPTSDVHFWRGVKTGDVWIAKPEILFLFLFFFIFFHFWTIIILSRSLECVFQMPRGQGNFDVISGIVRRAFETINAPSCKNNNKWRWGKRDCVAGVYSLPP
jgi:hypothetical protein